MAKKTEPVSVRIDHRILFIGDAAYPLQGIVGFRPVTLVVNKWAAFRSFIMWSLIPAALIFYDAVVREDPYSYYDPYTGVSSGGGGTTAATPIGIIGLVILLVVLLARLSRPPLHVLRIQNAAGSVHLLSTEERSLVDTVVTAMIEAIDQPTFTFGPIQMTSITAGRDYINSSGSDNKITTGASA